MVGRLCLQTLVLERLRQKELHELQDSLDYKLKSYLKMKQSKNKVSIEFKKRQEKRIKTFPTKLPTQQKKAAGRGEEFQLALKSAMAEVTLLLKITSNSPTKSHKSNERIKSLDPSIGCLQHSLQI